jgi:hypothetical protein
VIDRANKKRRDLCIFNEGIVLADADRPKARTRRATGRVRFIRLFMDLTPDVIFVWVAQK